MARPKIALLYVGGSIGMKMNRKTGRIEPIESLNEIHRFLPELQREVALKFFSLNNVGSSEVTQKDWVEIAQTIERSYDDYEGFVVVHGTNTMSYTAAALSFALQGLSKPVILTGALLPINDISGDGRMNLVYAIRAAQLDIAEVCVVLGPRVLRGCRAKKVDQSLLQTFDTTRIPPLAEFNEGVHLGEHRCVRRKRQFLCRPSFDPHVAVVTLHPALEPAFLDAVLSTKPHGIVMRAYGPGMLPERIFPWLRRVTAQGIPIVMTSQTIRGRVDLHRFRKQTTLEQFGVISGKDQTFECALVKLMWALTQTQNAHRLRELMEKSLTGELAE
ncbi:MAG: asparaginase [Candidatus Peribacteraceae bacterium]|nr:asparaginase [Candidatus Peribacteraceae bacterium]MDD5742137.1 asparaginase [Candidatus Peribacteraceae bacterium]